MKHKKWSVSELQNLLAMIFSGFSVLDMCLAFKCTKKQIYTACNKHFDMSVMFIRQRYKIEVMK
tara:strand:+ start:385 stop:576 length:192 start_codon:yes stop_codon:yes gene_type:complete